MVNAPILFATSATIGAAPVPVPPPIPAVTNTDVYKRQDQFGEDELDVEAEFIRMGHEWKASRDEQMCIRDSPKYADICEVSFHYQKYWSFRTGRL